MYAWVLAFVCVFLCGVCVQNRRTNEWRLLRRGGLQRHSAIKVTSLPLLFFLSRSGDDVAWLQARFSFIIFEWVCVGVLLFRFFSYPIRTWQETISYRRCIKCVNVCVCVFPLFFLPLSLALSHLLTFRFRCVCVFSLFLSFTNLPFVFIFSFFVF